MSSSTLGSRVWIELINEWNFQSSTDTILQSLGSQSQEANECSLHLSGDVGLSARGFPASGSGGSSFWKILRPSPKDAGLSHTPHLKHKALPTLCPGSQKPQPLLYAALGRAVLASPPKVLAGV